MIAGVLIVLLGLGTGLAAFALRGGAPDSWTDVSATDEVVRAVARRIAIVSAALLVSGVMTLLRVPWGPPAGAAMTLAFTAGGFWANYRVFGDYRPMHTVTNSVIALAILILLSQGM